MLGKVTLYKNRVVIYYSRDGKILRHSTGVTIDNPKLLGKDGIIKSGLSEHQSINLIIQNNLTEVNRIIKEYHLQFNSPPPVSFVKNKLKNPNKPLSQNNTFLEGYELFLEDKRLFFSEKNRSVSSLKDYVSFKNSIIDFQTFTKKVYIINEFTKDILSQYKRFLEMIGKDRGTGKFITKGGLNQNTIRKRFSCLKSFYHYLDLNEIYQLPHDVKNFRLESEPVEVISISREEVSKLLKLELVGTQKKVRDTFIFSCLTGLRWGDLITLNKSQIKKEGTTSYIDKISVKTRVLVKIPLTTWGMKFLVEMDYNLRFISNQKFNETLKTVCKKSELFKDLTRSEDETGGLVPRYELLSIHKGRHTFISNLVKESVPVNEIMKYTGHKKLETLMKYINTQTPMTDIYIKKLEP